MRQHLIKTDGLTQQVLEAGEGPLVIFCHGFPELSWSWRRQLPAVAQAGYRAVAPDMRGYGGTDKPTDVAAYGILNIVGDMVDLVRALGETQAVIVGHDWGAPIAWHAALLRPDIFRAVAGLSVPFQARRPGRTPVATWRAVSQAKGLGEFYMVAFQEPGIEAGFEKDVERSLRRGFWAYDGATPDALRSTGFHPAGVSFVDSISEPTGLPAWLSEAELATYVAAFEVSGFGGPLNWYRNLDRNWSDLAFAQDKKIEVPALYVVGDKDPVRNYTAAGAAELSQWAPKLTESVVIERAGHWIQQERPDEINRRLIAFLNAL
ncbi:MAG TPA: alpha/beta hydrolase [Caulobacteraceae bacterium]|nr:alpha/beta hydrolase [Caulobacteraceae bacterium]